MHGHGVIGIAPIERNKDSVVPQFQDCAHVRCQSVRAGSRLQRVLERSSRLIEHVCPRFGKGSRNKAAENVASCNAAHASIWFAKRSEASQGDPRHDVCGHIRISQLGRGKSEEL